MSTKSQFSTRRPIHWILDWDGTITRRDTLDALVGIARSAKPNEDTDCRWKHVTQAYLDDYTKTIGALAPGGQLPTSISGEKELLLRLKDVEQRSLDRVFQSGIFAGLTAGQLKAGAQQAILSRKVLLRSGYDTLFKRIQSQRMQLGDELNLLSVNWSRLFIASCLQESSLEVDDEAILSNELSGIGEDVPSDGRVGGVAGRHSVISSADKLRELERLRDENVASGRPAYTVYIGDSWTDIECLLAADLGICIRDEPMGSSQKQLSESLVRLGITCPHIGQLEDTDQERVVWAQDYDEIQLWLETRSDKDNSG